MRKWLRLPLVIGIAVLLVGLTVAGYWFKWDWTGLPEHISPNTQQYQPAKTAWDWLNLLGVLAIPVVAGLGVAWFTAKQTQASEAANEQQRRTELEIADQRHRTELEIAADNQREAALQAYIDKMAELLLANDLRNSLDEEDEVRKIARVRTLTVLGRLDPIRKGSVLRFLCEAGLIQKTTTVIDLHGANLRNADLTWASLADANLSGVSLSGADLSSANLTGADLSFADLTGATLTNVGLSKANLSFADLTGATLTGSWLRGTDLTATTVTDIQLSDVRELQGVSR